MVDLQVLAEKDIPGFEADSSKEPCKVLPIFYEIAGILNLLVTSLVSVTTFPSSIIYVISAVNNIYFIIYYTIVMLIWYVLVPTSKPIDSIVIVSLVLYIIGYICFFISAFSPNNIYANHILLGGIVLFTIGSVGFSKGYYSSPLFFKGSMWFLIGSILLFIGWSTSHREWFELGNFAYILGRYDYMTGSLYFLKGK